MLLIHSIARFVESVEFRVVASYMKHWFCALMSLTTVFMHMDGIAVEREVRTDIPVSWLEEARRHEHGEGVPRDYAKAMDLYCSSASGGDPEGLYALGWMYANGRGVGRNDAVAVQLFELAAENGHTHAKQLLQHLPLSIKGELPECLTSQVAPQDAMNANAVNAEETVWSGPVAALVKRLAPHYNIDPQLVLAVISVESGFNAKAVSRKNAIGLMQLMPSTARRFRVNNPFDAEENIKGGMAYLRWLLSYFQGNVMLAAAAYNAGERAVEKYRGVPPYPETQDYVRKIGKLYNKNLHPY